MIYIGKLRSLLLIPGSWKWNAWVRDITAKYEGSWLIRSTGNSPYTCVDVSEK
jgi:hypothetical protein